MYIKIINELMIISIDNVSRATNTLSQHHGPMKMRLSTAMQRHDGFSNSLL